MARQLTGELLIEDVENLVGKEGSNTLLFGWAFVLISLGPPHVRPMRALNTCGGPNEIESAVHVLTGSFTAIFQASADLSART